jgi:Bacterial Ig-like domain (group 3)
MCVQRRNIDVEKLWLIGHHERVAAIRAGAFTATVTATGTAPVGSVTFKAAGQVVGVVPVSGGVASITLTSLKVGSTTINAKFQGTGFATVGKSLIQVVN